MMRDTFGTLTIAASLLVGCGGSDGDPGAAGPPGPPGPPPVPATVNLAEATQVAAQIDAVNIASSPIVEFSLADAAGIGVVGLPPGAISFTLARLVPGTDGNPRAWQSYINRVEAADGQAPDALPDARQAATENGSAGTLVDNADGSYVYTFATDPTSVPDIDYDPTLTHRVGFEIRGFVPVHNPVFTFRPSDGAIRDLFSRRLVSNSTCNLCHDNLSVHGGARFDVDYCVTCHNPGSVDQDSGNSLDMSPMIHKIHHGADLPSVQSGGSYTIYGFMESEHDYSEVVFPQDIRNCRNCHDENDATTPDAVNWLTTPNVAACSACHDDVDFATGEGHGSANLAVTNADCTVCHRDGGLVGAVDASHVIAELRAAEAYQFNILDVQNVMPGAFPEVMFSVTNPADNDTAYDIANDAPFTQGSGASRIAIDIGWDTVDFTNRGSGSATPTDGAPAQVISLNPLFGGATNIGGNVFRVTSGIPIPADVNGSALVAIEGHPAEDLNGDGTPERIPVAGAATTVAVTDPAPVPRRTVVDLARCNDCHQSLSLHGANRTDNIELCVVCHNADATDISRRPATGAIDGRSEQTVDFKYLVHALHAGTQREDRYVVYGFGGVPHDYSGVVYPGNLARCDSCHTGPTFYPLDTSVLATTIDSGPDRSTPFDDVNITPTTSACAACHDTPPAMGHMQQNGGAFDAAQTPDGALISASAGSVIESCAVCHGPGRHADVRDAHGF